MIAKQRVSAWKVGQWLHNPLVGMEGQQDRGGSTRDGTCLLGLGEFVVPIGRCLAVLVIVRTHSHQATVLLIVLFVVAALARRRRGTFLILFLVGSSWSKPPKGASRRALRKGFRGYTIQKQASIDGLKEIVLVLVKLSSKGLRKRNRGVGIGGTRSGAGWRHSRIVVNLKAQIARGNGMGIAIPSAIREAISGRAERWVHGHWRGSGGSCTKDSSGRLDNVVVKGLARVKVLVTVGTFSNVIILVNLHFVILVLGIIHEASRFGLVLFGWIDRVGIIASHVLLGFLDGRHRLDIVKVAVVLNRVVPMRGHHLPERFPSVGRNLCGRSIDLGIRSEDCIVKVFLGILFRHNARAGVDCIKGWVCC